MGRPRLPPEDLDAAIDHTLFAKQILRPDDSRMLGEGLFNSASGWEGDGLLAREPRRRLVLIVRLAAELYRREHGKLPSTASELVGAYLSSLPEGIAADGPIPPPEK